MKIKLFNDGSDKVKNRTLSEAKVEDYQFRIHQDEEEILVPSSEVEITPEGIKYIFDGGQYNLSFSKFTIQILPSSKTVNIIYNPSRWIRLLFISVPMIIGLTTIQNRSFIAPIIQVSEDTVLGFGCAVIVVAYITQIGSVFFLVSLRKRRALRAVSSGSQLITKLEKAQDVEDYFSKLIQVNLSNMEQYYLLVRTQTEKSYKLTQAASIVGFAILVSGIILSFQQGLNSPATALTVACGILVEFISVIFFYIYNKTISQLNTYHEKLVAVQDTMLALKVAQIVKDPQMKDATMAYLTKALTSKLGRVGTIEPNQTLNADSETNPAAG